MSTAPLKRKATTKKSRILAKDEHSGVLDEENEEITDEESLFIGDVAVSTRLHHSPCQTSPTLRATELADLWGS
jgi:hypothetical protein